MTKDAYLMAALGRFAKVDIQAPGWGERLAEIIVGEIAAAYDAGHSAAVHGAVHTTPFDSERSQRAKRAIVKRSENQLAARKKQLAARVKGRGR